ncbi:hypothetical protein RND81_14G167400 [Saponaria officinalis]
MEGKLCIVTKDESPSVRSGDEGILPEDVMEEILLRLTVRHLVRLRCVCKSWCALIDDINFIKRHYRLHSSICKADGDVPGICFRQTFNDFRVYLVSKQNENIPLDLTPDLLCDTAASFTNAPALFNDGITVGIANGVVCFMWGYQNLGMWNPATRDFKVVTPWIYRQTFPRSLQLEMIGFGFDCISNDFKIVRINRCDGGTCIHEVYSLSTDTWKKLREPSPLEVSRSIFQEGYSNGVCYCYSNYDDEVLHSSEASNPLIMSFNFSTEVFEVINYPVNTIGSKAGCEYDWTIAIYRESLALVICWTDLRKAECNYEVCVITESQVGNSGIQKSWQRLFALGPFPLYDGRMNLEQFRSDGDVLFTIGVENGDPKLILYNPLSGTFKNLGTRLFRPYDYVESLFPLSKRRAHLLE